MPQAEQGTQTPAPPVSEPVAPPTAALAPAMPWDGVPPEVNRAYHILIPAPLYLKLKWIGDTTYDSSMRQFVLSVLERAAEEALKGRKQ